MNFDLNFYFFSAEKQGNKPKSVGNESQSKSEPTWVEDLFQGTFTNETRCLNCETVSMVIISFVHLTEYLLIFNHFADGKWFITP